MCLLSPKGTSGSWRRAGRDQLQDPDGRPTSNVWLRTCCVGPPTPSHGPESILAARVPFEVAYSHQTLSRFTQLTFSTLLGLGRVHSLLTKSSFVVVMAAVILLATTGPAMADTSLGLGRVHSLLTKSSFVSLCAAVFLLPTTAPAMADPSLGLGRVHSLLTKSSFVVVMRECTRPK